MSSTAERRRPRVVILVENLPVPLDRRSWLEAQTLARGGWDVVIISPRQGKESLPLRERVDGIEVLRYPQWLATGLLGYLAEYLPSMMFTFAWLVVARGRGRIDIVHGSNPPDLFWILGLLGRSWGARFVFDQHDPGPELTSARFGSAGFKGRLLRRLSIALETASFRAADLVLTVNETCQERAVRRGNFPRERVLVLRNLSGVGAVQHLTASIEPERYRVGYVGVMGFQDGVGLLIDAWALVRRHPDMGNARLDLIGDGPARPAAERRATELGVQDSVRFYGFLPAARYAPILAGCEIGVSPDPPSPFNDLASMVKLADYMALGRASVAFDLTETRRLVGDAGLLVEPHAGAEGLARAIVQLLRDPQTARRLGERGRARVRALQQEANAAYEQLPGAYRRLL